MSKICLMLSVLVVLAGCNPYAYVNVPPQVGDIATHDPNQKMVREVEVEALRSILIDRPLAGPVAITLPEGTSELMHVDVARRISDDVVSALEVPDAASQIHMTQVRIRGLRAQVDMLYPTVAGMPQLLTVYLSYTPFNNWRSDRIMDWPGATHAVDHGGVLQP